MVAIDRTSWNLIKAELVSMADIVARHQKEQIVDNAVLFMKDPRQLSGTGRHYRLKRAFKGYFFHADWHMTLKQVLELLN